MSPRRQAAQVGQLQRGSCAPTDFAVSPDLHWVATTHVDDSVFIWDLPRHRIVQVIPQGDTSSHHFSVAFIQGSRLLTSDDNAVRLWTLNPLRQEWAFEDVWSGSYEMVTSGDQQRLAYGTSQNQIVVRDSRSGTKLRAVSVPEGAPRRPALDHAGRRLAYLGADGSVRVWDVGTGRLIGERVATTQDRSYGAVLLSRDGKQVVYQSGEGRDIHLWDLATGKNTTVTGPGPVKVMALHPAGRFLAVAMDGRENPKFFVVDLLSGAPPVPYSGHRDGVFQLAFSADGRFLLSGDSLTCDIWIWRFFEDPSHPLLKHLGHNVKYRIGPGTKDD